MTEITIKLTELQLGEIRNKLLVVGDDVRLQEFYNITESEAILLFNSLHQQKSGVIKIDARYIDVIIGELENCVRVSTCQWNVTRKRVYIAYRRSIQEAINKIQAVV